VLELHAVIDETALRGNFESSLMRDQFQHIVMLAELPNVTVQVVPRSVGPYDGPRGSFVLASFPDVEEPDIEVISPTFSSVGRVRNG
jgi:hypothetical protein